MRVRLLIVMFFAVGASTSCSPVLTTKSPLPSPSPSTVSPSSTASTPDAPLAPKSWCADELSQAVCESVEQVVLAAVVPSGWTPTEVWINTGLFCPDEGCLFDPSVTFPYTMPPEGGQWVANAEVAFAETDKHAGLHIARVGDDLVPSLIGFRVPDPAWCSGYCPAALAEDDQFWLELVLPRLTWKTSESITGSAILGLRGDEVATIYGSGAGVVYFTFDEVGGARRSGYAMNHDCAPHTLDPATPTNVNLYKSGGVAGNEPNVDFLRSFFADPEIHLPVGTWDVTAIVTFAEMAGCESPTHEMQTSLRVTVTE